MSDNHLCTSRPYARGSSRHGTAAPPTSPIQTQTKLGKGKLHAGAVVVGTRRWAGRAHCLPCW